jgi:serine/threonine-protein kinase HipA
MNRKGKVFFEEKFAGVLSEDENGYTFEYDEKFMLENNQSISLTLPINKNPHVSKTMFPFFDGLIPEGWLLNIAVENWKLDSRDRMGLLLTVCKDCIGAVSILPFEEISDE